MIRYSLRTALVATSTAAIISFGITPAHAATQSGTYNCGGFRVAQMTSDTTGSTFHQWTNTDNGTVRRYTDTNGGVFRSSGFQRNQWLLGASLIRDRSLTCVG